MSETKMLVEDRYQPELLEAKADQFVLISGCSGGGKSALLAELGRRGFPIYPEAGRQIVKEQLFIGGDALPWTDLPKFVEISIYRTMHNLISAAGLDQICFFDRGIVDQVSALERLGLPVPHHLSEALRRCRYHRQVFMTPPWREIFRTDEERRHGFEDAVASYEHLVESYGRHGYEIVIIPTLDVAGRADFLLDRLSLLEPRP